MKTNELLHKYVSQGLSKEERFELEKRALDDDFLAEAWEGLQLHQGSDLHKKWASIQSEWQAKYSSSQNAETKVISMGSWVRYAASAAILLLGAVMFFMQSDESTQSDNGIVALETMEVADQTVDATDESTIDLDVVDREEELREEEIVAKVEKLKGLTNAAKEAPSINDITAKNQPSSPKVNEAAAYAAPAQAEEKIESTSSQNTLVSKTPTAIPNPKPSPEGRAAIPIKKEAADFGNIEISNAQDVAVDAKLEKESLEIKKPISTSSQSRKSLDSEGAKISPTLKDAMPARNNASLLKKRISNNSNLGDDSNQAQLALQKARDLFIKDKKYQEARDEALKALALEANISEGYELIGDIYAAASFTCGEDQWSQSLAVLAAYDQYVKASTLSGNSNLLAQKISSLQDRFPAKEDGFQRGINAGEKVTVPCWIGETVIIRFR